MYYTLRVDFIRAVLITIFDNNIVIVFFDKNLERVHPTLCFTQASKYHYKKHLIVSNLYDTRER